MSYRGKFDKSAVEELYATEALPLASGDRLQARVVRYKSGVPKITLERFKGSHKDASPIGWLDLEGAQTLDRLFHAAIFHLDVVMKTRAEEEAKEKAEKEKAEKAKAPEQPPKPPPMSGRERRRKWGGLA